MPNKKHLHKYALITAVKSSKNNQRPHLIKSLDNQAIDILSECVYNTCFVNQSLSKREKNRIRNIYKDRQKAFKSIAKKTNSIKTRRKLLAQNGSSLSPILSIAAKLLSSALFGHK